METLKNDVERMRALIEKVRQEHEGLLPEVARDYDPIVNRFLNTYEDAFTERPQREGGSMSLLSDWVSKKYVLRLDVTAAVLEDLGEWCDREIRDPDLRCAISAAFTTVRATSDAIQEWTNYLNSCIRVHEGTFRTLLKFAGKHDYEAVNGIAHEDEWFVFEQDYDEYLDNILNNARYAKRAMNELWRVISEVQLRYPVMVEFEEDVDALLDDCINIAEAQFAELKDKPNLRFCRFWIDRIETLIEFVGSMLLPKLPNVLEFIRDNHKAAPKEMLDGLPAYADFVEALSTTLVSEE